jgi:hypothetical protein
LWKIYLEKVYSVYVYIYVYTHAYMYFLRLCTQDGWGTHLGSLKHYSNFLSFCCSSILYVFFHIKILLRRILFVYVYYHFPILGMLMVFPFLFLIIKMIRRISSWLSQVGVHDIYSVFQKGYIWIFLLFTQTYMLMYTNKFFLHELCINLYSC